IRIAAKMLAPKTIGQDHFESAVPAAGPLVIARKCPTHRRFDPKDVEQFRARLQTAQAGCALFSRKGKAAVTINRDACESVVLIPEIEKIGIGERTETCLILLAGVGHAKRDQLLWCRKRKRPQ